MIEDYLALRNKLHRQSFRFDLPANLWAAHYIPNQAAARKNVVQVDENGTLEGYAVYEPMFTKEVRAYRILEVCATSKNVEAQLIDLIVKRAVEDKIDFVFTRKSEEAQDIVFDEKKFVTFVDCVIMCALLDPYKLVLSLSSSVEKGDVVELTVDGFDPILVRIGQQKLEVLKSARPNARVRMNSRTFLKLFFGRTSFLKEFFKGKIRLNNIWRVSAVAALFDQIKQESAYLPLGDWT